MNENEKDQYLRKCFNISSNIGVPPHFLKAYDIFEHMLGLKDDQVVPEGLLALYKKAKSKSDALFSGADLPMQTLILLAVLYQVLDVPKQEPNDSSAQVKPAIKRRPGRPPKVRPSEVVNT